MEVYYRIKPINNQMRKTKHILFCALLSVTVYNHAYDIFSFCTFCSQVWLTYF